MSISLFLLLDGIAGDAKADKFAGQIELLSASFNGNSEVVTQGGGGGSAVGKVSFGPLLVTKNYDSASPTLFQKLCTGAVIGHGKISAVVNGAATLLTIDLAGLLVTGMTTSITDSGPTDSLSFHYQTIQISYRSQNPDGTLSQPVVTGWDLSKNAPLAAPTIPPINTPVSKLPISVLNR